MRAISVEIEIIFIIYQIELYKSANMLYNPNRYGALAQLVECHTGSVDVSGSSPLCSTKAESDELLLLAFGLRSKGDDLRMQKFCHLLWGWQFYIEKLNCQCRCGIIICIGILLIKWIPLKAAFEAYGKGPL